MKSAMFDAMLAFGLVNALSVKEKVESLPALKRSPRKQAEPKDGEERTTRFFADIESLEDAA
jgi:hypothetical protein